jgi:hypothetical protein
MPDIYKTSDGREFESRYYAESHAQELAEEEAKERQRNSKARADNESFLIRASNGDTQAMWYVVGYYEDNTFGAKNLKSAIYWCEQLVAKMPNVETYRSKLAELKAARVDEENYARRTAEHNRRMKARSEANDRRGPEPNLKSNLIVTVVLWVLASIFFRKLSNYFFFAGVFLVLYFIVRRIMYAFYAGPRARRITLLSFAVVTFGLLGLNWYYEKNGTINIFQALQSNKTVAVPAASLSTATVTANALNLRSEPSTSGAVVKALKKGDALTVTGETANGWTPVEYDGAKGYVSAQYIEVK